MANNTTVHLRRTGLFLVIAILITLFIVPRTIHLVQIMKQQFRYLDQKRSAGFVPGPTSKASEMPYKVEPAKAALAYQDQTDHLSKQPCTTNAVEPLTFELESSQDASYTDLREYAQMIVIELPIR